MAVASTASRLSTRSGDRGQVGRGYQTRINHVLRLFVQGQAAGAARRRQRGAAKSQRREANTDRLQAFLAGPLEWTELDDQDAREAGVLRAELEVAGKPIGAHDVLIAGQARRRQATLVTSKVAEFARVAGVKWEDWAASRR